jgi:hypothetical protein
MTERSPTLLSQLREAFDADHSLALLRRAIATPSVTGQEAAFAALLEDELASGGRRAKAAAFREGDCGGTAPNPALIGRIASFLFRACFSLLSPCSLPVKYE